MILHGLRRIRADTAIKYFIASNLVILLNNGFTTLNAQTNEQWPAQPQLRDLNNFLIPLQTPPFRPNKTIALARPALFFKHRHDLDAYKDSPKTIDDLLTSGRIVPLPRGRLLRTLELITTYEGQFADEQLGDGYVIMTPPF